MTRSARLAAAAAMAAAALLGFAAPASAHAEVTNTSPQAGSTVRGTLTQISVTFSEAVTLVPHAMRMATDQGIPVNLETARLSQGGTVLSARVQDHLAAGGYAVVWRVQADDGHLESSTFAFSIAASGTAHPVPAPIQTGPPPTPGEPLWPVLVAAAIAVTGGLGAGVAVRRGLRLVRSVPVDDFGHGASPRDHETLRLPM